MDLNHGPRPYQGRALTELSYGPILGVGKCIAALLTQREPSIPTGVDGRESVSALTEVTAVHPEGARGQLGKVVSSQGPPLNGPARASVLHRQQGALVKVVSAGVDIEG